MRLKASLLVISICLLAAIPAWTEETSEAAPVQLRHKFRAGDIQRYKMVCKMKINFAAAGLPTPPSGMEMGGSFVAGLRAKTLGILPNGDAKVLFTYESVDFDFNIPGMPGMDAATKAKMKKEVASQMPSVTMTMSPYGQVTGVTMPQGTPSLQQMPGFDKLMGGQGMGVWSVVFPAEGVMTGDAWTQDIPILDAGKITVDSTLESLNAQVGSRVAAKIRQDFTGGFQLGDLMKAIAPAMGANAAQTPQVDGNVDAAGWGVTYFDVNKGHIVRSDADMNMKLNMTAQIPGGAQMSGSGPQGQSVDISMNMNLTFNMINVTNSR